MAALEITDCIILFIAHHSRVIAKVSLCIAKFHYLWRIIFFPHCDNLVKLVDLQCSRVINTGQSEKVVSFNIHLDCFKELCALVKFKNLCFLADLPILVLLITRFRII